MALSDTAVPSGNPHLYSVKMRSVLESHLPFLMEHHAGTVQISSVQDVRYRHDFYGLLGDLGIRRDTWWVIMRLNGLTRHEDYTGGRLNIVIVSSDIIDEILSSSLAMA